MNTPTREDICQLENEVFSRTTLLTEKNFSYCPGCGHGTAHRLIMEVIEEMNLQADTIGVTPVGCSVLGHEFLNIDIQVINELEVLFFQLW